MPTEIADSPAAKVLNKLQKAIQRDAAAPALAARVAEELAVADAAGQGSGRLFLSLAAAYALPQLSDAQEGKPFAEIIAAIHSLVHQPDLDVEADPVNWLLSAVELPLVLGFTADPIDSHRLAELSSRYSLFVEQNLEEEGWVP
ncbi:MAG: hypothetical protein ACK53V_01825, partial [Planctomycetota bacterium]